MFFELWSNLFLLVCAVIDLKTKRVYQNVCVINYMAAIGIKLLLGDIDAKSFGLGIVLCVVLLIISIITKEAIGQGDVLIILTLTGILKIGNVLEIIFISLLVCSVFSMAMLLIKKMKLKNVIPFVPFLFIGHILWIILGGKYA